MEQERAASAGVARTLEHLRGTLKEGEQDRARLDRELLERRAAADAARIALEAAEAERARVEQEAAAARMANEQLTSALERERAEAAALRRTLDHETLAAVEEATVRAGAERQETARIRQLLDEADRQRSTLLAAETDARSGQEQLRTELDRQQSETAQAMLTVAALQEELTEMRAAREEEREVSQARFQALDDQRIGAERALKEAEARYLAIADGVGLLEGPPAEIEEVTVADVAVAFESDGSTGERPVRQVHRYRVKDEVSILIDSEPVRLVDVSTRGVQVLSAKTLKPNSSVKLRLPIDGREIAGRGRVVWAQLEPASRHSALRYRAGLRFTTIDESAVAKFIDEYARQPQPE